MQLSTLDLSGILRERTVRRQHLFQGGEQIVRLHVLGGEDAGEVLFRGVEERRLVLVAHPDERRQRIQGLAVADGHIAGELLFVAVDEHRGLPVGLHHAVLGAARGTGGDAKGLVAGGPVRGRRQHLRRNAILTVEQLGTPSTTSGVVLSGGHGACGSQDDDRGKYELLIHVNPPDSSIEGAEITSNPTSYRRPPPGVSSDRPRAVDRMTSPYRTRK